MTETLEKLRLEQAEKKYSGVSKIDPLSLPMHWGNESQIVSAIYGPTPTGVTLCRSDWTDRELHFRQAGGATLIQIT